MKRFSRALDMKPCVEPSQSVEGYWTVIRGGEVLLITSNVEEAEEVCRRIAKAGTDRPGAKSRLEPVGAE